MIIYSITVLNKNVLPVASSGIASCLLKNGCTFHSTFKAPLTVERNMTLNISHNSYLGRILTQSDFIIFKEAPMIQMYLLKALDRLVSDLFDASVGTFGGKVVVLAGDFRQCLPVIRRAARADCERVSFAITAVAKIKIPKIDGKCDGAMWLLHHRFCQMVAFHWGWIFQNGNKEDITIDGNLTICSLKSILACLYKEIHAVSGNMTSLDQVPYWPLKLSLWIK